MARRGNGRTLFQDPGTMFQDPGTLFQDPGTMFDHYPFSPPAEFTKKKRKKTKFHFGFLEKVQIWTKNSTYYPFSPPAEFTKKSKKSKVPLWILRKGPKLDQKFDVLPLLATG